MNKLDNLLIVKEELLKRISDYDSYKDIYLLETLKNQLIQNNKLIEKELINLKSIAIRSREDVVLSKDEKQIHTNIDNNVSIVNDIISGSYDILSLNDIDLYIKTGITNKVYISSNEKKTINKNDILAYLVPCKELKNDELKER